MARDPPTDSPNPLWLETPLIFSRHLSHRLGCNVYLKLENLQPCQSFKYRGISHFVQHVLKTRGRSTQLIVASGGNAGLAAATAAKDLKMKCTVFLPHGASPPILVFFEQEGAEVVVHGTCYAEALKAAEAAVSSNVNAVMVPAYDDPVVWEGHGSMVEEIARQLPIGVKPDALFCSAGGGGLAGGVMVGCKSVGWDDVPLVILETTGSNCVYQSIALNRSSHPDPDTLPGTVEIVQDTKHNLLLAHLTKLNSRASSLGASIPSAGIIKMALEREGGVKCVCGPDELAMLAALSFAEDHKMLVELACSTTLIPAYNPKLFHKLVVAKADGDRLNVVFIVCGGFKTSLEELAEYQIIIDGQQRVGGSTWEILLDGEILDIPRV